jgi:uncharacterized membrane protein
VPFAPKGRTERLAAYSDGIMAVVATLLVLGIAVPSEHEFAVEGVWAFLEKIRHDVRAYALSFLIITSYWMQHHVIFSFLQQASRRFAWINCLLLFFITLIPFATKLMATYRHDTYVVLLYGILQVICGMLLVVLWSEAHEQHRTTVRELDPRVNRSMTLRILFGPWMNLIGVAASPSSVPLALICFLAAPLANLSHRRVDRAI